MSLTAVASREDGETEPLMLGWPRLAQSWRGHAGRLDGVNTSQTLWYWHKRDVSALDSLTTRRIFQLTTQCL